MWYYYFCSHGPGHQSHSDGFFEMPENAKKSELEFYLEDRFRGYDYPINRYWKVEPSQNFVDDHVKKLKRELAQFRAAIKELKKEIQACSTPIGQRVGEDSKKPDKEVMLALAGRKTESLLKTLHRNGIVIDYSRLYHWQAGHSSPSPEIRQKVIERGKKAKRYIACTVYPGGKRETETKKQWLAKNIKLVEIWLKWRAERKKETADHD